MIGMMGLFGVSIKFNQTDDVIFGAGPNYTDPLKRQGIWGAGVLWEKNSKQFLSVMLNSTENLKYRLNIFPRFFHPYFERQNYDLSLMMGIHGHQKFVEARHFDHRNKYEDENGKFVAGLNLNLPLGFIKAW